MSSTTLELATPAAAGLPAKQRELWLRYAKSGAGSPSENSLIEQYLPLVKTVVGRLAMTLPSHVNRDDLYSAGLVGLLNAVRRFDQKCGASFEHYARVRIRGAILDELRRLDWVPRSVHDKAKKVARIMQELGPAPWRHPRPTRRWPRLDLSLGDYEDLLEEIRPASYVCLDSVQDDGVEIAGPAMTSSRTMRRPIPGRRQHAGIGRPGRRAAAATAEMQRKVLALYYFEDLRLREIAEVFGVTESRICQIHAKAILALKALLKQEDPDVFAHR